MSDHDFRTVRSYGCWRYYALTWEDEASAGCNHLGWRLTAGAA